MFNTNSLYTQNILSLFNIEVKLDLPDQKRHLVNDTRQICAGDIFCAVNGTRKQGKEYIAQALEKGCHLVILECENSEYHGRVSVNNGNNQQVQVIEFYQLNKQLFSLAKAFYQQPQHALTMIGVTGTNGKTSTSQMIAKLLEATGKACSVIGTNGAGKVDQLKVINNTTPGATELHQLLQGFVESKQSAVAMEVSSHALDQGRVCSDLFDVAIFTNLTRDHLDYHFTMDNYAQAKFKIFNLDGKQIAIINADDTIGLKWLKNWPQAQNSIAYGRSTSVNGFPQFVHASNIIHQPDGVKFQLTTHVGSIDIVSQLIGDFNIDNLLAAISVLINQNISLIDIKKSVEKLTPIIGRMESFLSINLPLAVVDYAHTPDALSNALQACRQHCAGKLWVIFGCGGDRDIGKRPLMGEIAELHSDHVILTNDNPRTESAERIAQDILAGCQQPEKITVMLDRQKAVISTLRRAQQNDVVLLAGKGHEDYIIIGDKHIPYNERELVRSTYAHGAIS